jgi:hypothetical protein
MAKRQKMSWEDIEAGTQDYVDRWGDWLDELIGEGNEKQDRDFEVDAPRMEMTGSSNPQKPRTVQAGYDAKNKVLTVVFRDGTWWEYRDVPRDLWEGFRSADSKGRFLRSSGLDGWADMGPANIGEMPRHRRVQMNDIKEFTKYMYSSNNKE